MGGIARRILDWGRYAKLKKWLYGMRKAAAGWEEDYAKRLEDVGFRRGRGAPTVFYNEKTQVRIVVHGDDFTFSGVKAELLKMRSTMEKWYDIKNRGMMGSDVDDIKKVTILGRMLRWTEDGLEYDAKIGHRRKVMEAEGLGDGSNKAPCPAVKEDVGKAEFD